MKKTIVHNAQTNFLKLLKVVMNGDEIIIVKAGKPVAKLVPMSLKKPKRKPGSMKGRIKISKDFNVSFNQF